MEQTKSYLGAIENFLSQKRVAFIGVSRQSRDIGVSLMKEFERQGYEVLPVNPNASEICGKKCFSRVQDIVPAPDAALILTSARVTDTVVRECEQSQIKHIWLYRGGAGGAVTQAGIQYCREHDMEVVPGACPFMFLEPVKGIHWLHRFCSKLVGSYPQREN